MRLRSAVVAMLVATLISACAGDDAPRADSARATTTTVPEHFLRAPINADGVVVEPPLDGFVARWTPAEARESIRHNRSFDNASTRVWLVSYEGQQAWLAITDGLEVAPSRGRRTRGYRLGVFIDGEQPARLISPLVEAGGEAPRVNADSRPRKYNGRLHVTFVTPSGGPVGGSLAKWMMEPAPWATPRLTLEQARTRSESTRFAAMKGDSGRRLYFGLFTGLDDSGTMRTRAPAWMVYGTGYMTRFDGGPCCDRPPETFDPPLPTFGVAVFGDRDDWVSGVLSGGGHPLVY